MPNYFENGKDSQKFAKHLVQTLDNHTGIKWMFEEKDGKPQKSFDAEMDKALAFLMQFVTKEQAKNAAATKEEEKSDAAYELYSLIQMLKTFDLQLAKAAYLEEDRALDAYDKFEVMMKPISTGNMDPERIFLKFVNKYGYKELDDDRIKLLDSYCGAMKNVSMLVNRVDRQAKIKEFNEELNEINGEQEKFVKDFENYIKACGKLGIDVTKLNNLDNELVRENNDIVTKINDHTEEDKIKALREKNEKIVEKLTRETDAVKEKIDAFKKEESQLSKVEKELNAKRDECEEKLAQIDAYNIEIANNLYEIGKVDERLKELSEKSKYCNDMLREKELFLKDKSKREVAAAYDRLLERSEILADARTTFMKMVEEGVDIGALKEKKELTDKERETLRKYDTTKRAIIENFYDVPFDSRITDFFNTVENQKDISMPNAFLVNMGMKYTEQCEYIKERIDKMMSENFEDLTKYATFNKAIKDVSGARIEAKEQQKIKESYEKRNVELGKQTEANRKFLSDFSNKITKDMGLGDKKAGQNGFQWAWLKNELDNKKAELKKKAEEINLDAYENKLEKIKAAKEEIKNTGFFSSMAYAEKQNKRIAVLELKKKVMTAAHKKYTQLQEKMMSIANRKNALQAKYKEVSESNAYSYITDKLRFCAEHVLDKPKNPNDIKKSTEFGAFEDQLHNVISNLAKAKDDDARNAMLKDLKDKAQHYIKEKEKKWVPKIFASEQRHVRLHYAREVVNFAGTAMDILKTKQNERQMEEFFKTGHYEMTKEVALEKTLDFAEKLTERLQKESKLEPVSKNAFSKTEDVKLKDIEKLHNDVIQQLG